MIRRTKVFSLCSSNFIPPVPPRNIPATQPAIPSQQSAPKNFTPSTLILALIQQNINWYNAYVQLLNQPHMIPLTLNIIHHQMRVASENIHQILNMQTDFLCNQVAKTFQENIRQISPQNSGPAYFGQRFRPSQMQQQQRQVVNKTFAVNSEKMRFTTSELTHEKVSTKPNVHDSAVSSEQEPSMYQKVLNFNDKMESILENQLHSQIVVPLDDLNIQTGFDVVKDEKFIMPRPIVKCVKKGETFEIFVVKVLSPKKFWFQYGVKEAAKLMTQMNNFYASNGDDESLKIKASDIKKGLYVAAKIYEEWNRAEALNEADDDGFVSLRFIDFGSQTLVEIKDIRFLKREFTDHTVKAFRGSLVGVLPLSENTWSPNAGKSFYHKVNNVSLQANIKDISIEDEIYFLEIFNNNSSITEEMIAEGVASAGQKECRLNAILE